MILPRLEFLSMAKFMLAVMPGDEKTEKNCLFVRNEQGKYIFTAGGTHASKRVILNALDASANAFGNRGKITGSPERFMIPKSALSAFVAMIEQHKSICKNLAKNDPDYLNIIVGHKELESIGDFVHYEQPKFQFKDLETLFSGKRIQSDQTHILPGEMSAVMAGFQKKKPVDVSFCESTIYFKQESTGYEAVMIPSEPGEAEPDQMSMEEIEKKEEANS